MDGSHFSNVGLGVPSTPDFTAAGEALSGSIEHLARIAALTGALTRCRNILEGLEHPADPEISELIVEVDSVLGGRS